MSLKQILPRHARRSEASKRIAETVLATNDVAATIHTHPTLSDAVMEAAANASGKAIYALNR